ncbi:maestro heat-like repeat-containing protein family member 1 [Leucoraja erinacea]|uniref:maestro heat-like repeat-containing protein family member 1 n=1 Tax=Leucoraja erinaceus TaxID=7782 RepID=UPI0024550A16|nr:maestro heat-like repeat-containing protein family member 1 [Leucoraja erinacea]
MKVEVWISALLSMSPDSSELVRQRVIESLQELGRIKRKRVLLFLHNFLMERQTLPMSQRTTLLKSVVLIVKENTRNLSRPLSKKMIAMASMEMSKMTGINDLHRESASKFLLVLGSSFPIEVFMELQSMLQRQNPAKFYVILTLANLCSENGCCIVPLLKPILDTILSLLNVETCKRMRWVFCYALGHFSKSILTYNSDPHLPAKKCLYVSELSSAYDILFQSWLNSRDPKMTTGVVEAIGQIIYLLPSDKIENELPALIPAILSLYQKSYSDLSVTKGLCGILCTALERNSKMLVSHLEHLLVTLHLQICISMDHPTSALSECLRSKILCCFQILSSSFGQEIARFLLLQLEISNDQIQLGALAILKHLINMVPASVETHKSQIMSSVSLSVLRSGHRVKGFLSQLVQALASHGYLELEGGVELVRFIVDQCALAKDEDGESHRTRGNNEPHEGGVTDGELKSLYERLLERLTATTMIDNVLWPLLLEFVVPARYTNALAAVCSSLAYLGSKKQQAGETEFVLNYDEHTNLPNRQALLTRLLAVSSSPYEGRGQGAPALSLLWVLGINVHPAAVNVWDKELPGLVNYLQECPEDHLVQNEWEQKLLQVLSRTLEEIEDEVWIVRLSEEMTKQIQRSHSSSQQKGFLYKCLGITLQLTQSHGVVKRKLQVMLQIVQHDKDLEREGVATAIGYCAQTHLETSLTVLKNCSKLNIFKKTASFYQIMKDHGNIGIMQVKSTLILCYGYIILHCPKDIILPRIETDILQNVLKHFNIKILGMKVPVRHPMMKLSLIKTVTLLATAFQCGEGQQCYKLSRKTELLTYMQEFIKAEPTDSLTTDIRKDAMDASSCLVNVEPVFVLNDYGELIKLCLNSIFSLPSLEAGESREVDRMKRQDLYNATLMALEDLLTQLLSLDLSPKGFQYLFSFLVIWIESTNNYERERSLMMTLHLLTFYQDTFVVNEKDLSHSFVEMIGYTVVRCSDPSLAVREIASECLYVLLCLQLRLVGFPVDHKDSNVEHLKTIKVGLKDTDFEALFYVCIDLGKVLSRCVPHAHVNTLLLTISERLAEEQLNGSYAASIVVNVLVRNCGTILTDIPGVIKSLYHQLQLITQPHVTRSVIHSISILASQNVPMVLPYLLKHQIPFQTYTDDIWRSLLSDSTLATTSIKYLLNNLKLMYDDNKESLMQEMVLTTQQSLAVIHALHAMICCPESDDAVNILYPQLFCVILLFLSSSVQICSRDFLRTPKQRKSSTLPERAGNADICNYMVEILQALLRDSMREDASAMEEKGWDLIKTPGRHHEGVMLLANKMAVCAVPHLISIVEELIPFLANLQERQRVAVAAFFAELLNHSVVMDLSLADTLVGSLLRCLIDTSPTIQGLAIRGLGNTAAGAALNIEKYSHKLLSALIAVIHKYWKSNNLMAMEAMSSIAKVLDSLQGHFADYTLIDVALTIESLFDNELEKMRASAFKVLGKLIRFGNPERNPVLAEHLHVTLINLLLHLNDESMEVTKVCRSVLKLMGPIVGSDSLGSVFQEVTSEDSALDYEAYLSKVSQHISEDLPDRVPSYIMNCAAFFTNPQAEIRQNAVTLIGLLMHDGVDEFATQLSADSVCKEICTLLSDPVRCVRLKAAIAIRHLHMY